MESFFTGKVNPLLIYVTAFIVGILYTFNVFTFFNFYFMFNPGAFVLALLPLNILALIKLYPVDGSSKLNKNNLWMWIFFASLFGMSPGFTVYVFFLQYLIWIGLYLLFFWIVQGRRIFHSKTLEIILFYVVIILANLWWFFPAFLDISASYIGQSSFGTTYWFDRGFQPSQLLNVMRFLGSGLMINNKFSWNTFYEDNNLFTFPLFIFPFLLISSVVFLRNKMSNVLIFMLSMTLVSLFIVKFSNPPFALILSFAFHYVPFFGGFRDAFQKAGVYFIQGYFVFIAMGFVVVTNYLIGIKRRIILVFFILLCIAGSIIISGPFSLFFGNNTKTISFRVDNKKVTINAKTQVPTEYYSLKHYLEDNKCREESIAIVPRSGFITDEVWKKYGTSYIGQDMLAGLVDCNFISTAMFNEHAEYAIQAPYIQLQQGDFAAFKGYLEQVGIRYVLIRHNFVPYQPLAWVYVNPINVENRLANDKDFIKVYNDDFFTLFEDKNIKKQQFGFKITRDAIYLQSGLRSGPEYAAISKTIGSREGVLLTYPYDQAKYEDRTIAQVISTDCLGCVKIETPEDANRGLLFTIKKYIKSIIHYKSDVPEDIRISLDIVNTDSLFSDLMASLDSDGFDSRLNDKINNYLNAWKVIDESIGGNVSDRFLRNNKYIEAYTALSFQTKTFFSYLSSKIPWEKKFSNGPANMDFVPILDFQKKLLGHFSQNITEIDPSNNTYRLRLDIPKDGDYMCRALPMNKNIQIKNVTIEKRNLTPDEYQGKAKIKVKRGSYFVNVLYTESQMRKIDTLPLISEQINEVKIGRLEVGTYRISFNLPTSLDGKLFYVVTEGDREKSFFENINHLENPGEGFISNDIIEKKLGDAKKYEYTFIVNGESPRDYYVYLFLLDSNNPQTEISNFSVSADVENGGIQFICSRDLRPASQVSEILSVTEDNPTHYAIQIPPGFKGFLTFNQVFNKDWIAYDSKKKRPFPHINSGYSNAWYVDNAESNEIIVEYTRQKIHEVGGIVSIALLIIGGAIYVRMRRK